MDPQEGCSAGVVCNGQINTWIRETIGEMEMTTSMIWLEIARVANEYAYVDRTPFHTSALTGRLWMQEMLTGREEAFQRNFRMPRDVFIKLCNTLVADFGLELPQRPHGIDVVESVGMFIYLLRGFPSWDIEDHFQHSGETVWRHFKRVLRAMKEFTRAHCRPTRPQNSRHPYLESQPKYLPFRVRCNTFVNLPCVKIVVYVQNVILLVSYGMFALYEYAGLYWGVGWDACGGKFESA